MQAIGSFKAKTHFSALLEQVEKGEQVLITKHGHPVAKLIPADKVNHIQAKQAIASIKEFSQHHTLGKLDWKKLRDEGRR